jgi:hypothetical protein
MKPKPSKPIRSKPVVELKDIKPKRDAKGGAFKGGVNVGAGFVTNNRDSD